MPDFLLRRAAEDMSDRLDGVQRDFTRMLTVGGHSALLAEILSGSVPSAELIVLADTEQVRSAERNNSVLCVQADEEALPFGDGAFDLVATALSLQFVNDLPGALVQIRRALRPDGLFLGSVLGGQTLHELREAFMEAELELEGGVSPRVIPMADLRDFGGLLQRAGFALPVVDSDLVTVTYGSPLALMYELRAMGAGNVLIERRKWPLRRATLQRAVEIYADRFGNGAGRINASFEIIHLSGWAPHDSQQQPLKPGSAQARLADALGAKEQPFKMK